MDEDDVSWFQHFDRVDDRLSMTPALHVNKTNLTVQIELRLKEHKEAGYEKQQSV